MKCYQILNFQTTTANEECHVEHMMIRHSSFQPCTAPGCAPGEAEHPRSPQLSSLETDKEQRQELEPSNPEWNKFPGPEAEGDSNEAGEKRIIDFLRSFSRFISYIFLISTLRINFRVPSKLGQLKQSFEQL